MRKIIALITVIMLTSTTSLQVMACTNNSKFEEFTTYVNSNNAFIGVLGAYDAPLCKTVIDSLNIMKSPSDNNPTSKWDDYLTSMQPTINKISNNKKIDIHTFIRPPFAKGTVAGDVVDKVWNDNSISWQKSIYHWLLSHMKDNSYDHPVPNAGIGEISAPLDSDKEKKFTALPIIFIINKGKLVTVGQSWNDKNDFFTQFTNLINGNLLLK